MRLASFSPCPLPPSFPPCPHFVDCGFLCSSSKLEGNWFCRCYDKVTDPVSQADVHEAPFHQHFVIQRVQTLWEQIGTTQRMGHKKLAENLVTLMCWRRRAWGWGGWQGEKSAEQNFMEVFFFFFGLSKDYYVLDTVNHLYTHIQEVNLQNSMRG